MFKIVVIYFKDIKDLKVLKDFFNKSGSGKDNRHKHEKHEKKIIFKFEKLSLPSTGNYC
jgi:hypothetical protein